MSSDDYQSNLKNLKGTFAVEGMSVSENMEADTMADHNKIQLFEGKKIRTAWDEEKEEW